MKNRTVVITGAGGGIGRAVAEKLAQCGVKIVLLGGHNIAKLEETEKIVAKYTSCLVLPGDLTSPEFLDESIEKTVEVCGGIDILINNAGVAQSTPFEDVSLEEYDKIMAVNVRVPFMLMQKCLPYLKKSSYAAIVNIASIVSHAGYPLQSIYSASKHALLGLTKSVAAEYYQQGIRVHAIAPGGVYTDMVKVSRPDLKPDGMIMPEDIAEIVHFMLANRTNAVIDEILVHRLNKQPFMV